MVRSFELLMLTLMAFYFGIGTSLRLERYNKKHYRLLRNFKSSVPAANNDDFDIKAWINPNTRGGVLVWAGLFTLVPIGTNNILVSSSLESSTVGAYVGAIFVLLTNLLWVSTYVFRVANKDMTYAKQLRDYENAVLQKRLDELGEQEVQVLLDEIENEKIP